MNKIFSSSSNLLRDKFCTGFHPKMNTSVTELTQNHEQIKKIYRVLDYYRIFFYSNQIAYHIPICLFGKLTCTKICKPGWYKFVVIHF